MATPTHRKLKTKIDSLPAFESHLFAIDSFRALPFSLPVFDRAHFLQLAALFPVFSQRQQLALLIPGLPPVIPAEAGATSGVALQPLEELPGPV